jgi:hypothetical protein
MSGKNRFLAEFTLSPFAALRAVRSGRANGLGMTVKVLGVAVLALAVALPVKAQAQLPPLKTAEVLLPRLRDQDDSFSAGQVGGRPHPILAVKHMDKGKLIAALSEHGATAFDAWASRRLFSDRCRCFYEENPLWKWASHSDGLIAATQLEPAAIDLLFWRFRHSRRGTKAMYAVAIGMVGVHIFAGVYGMSLEPRR